MKKNIEDERGELIFEIKKPVILQILPIIVSIILFIIIVSSTTVLSLFFFDEESLLYNPENENCGLALVLFIITFFGIIIYVTIRFMQSSYYFRLYKKGILITNRKEGDVSHLPKSFRDTISDFPHRRNRFGDCYIPLKEIDEIYAIRAEPTKYDKGGAIIFIDEFGRWYMFRVPFWTGLDHVLDYLEIAWGPQWNQIFTGIRTD